MNASYKIYQTKKSSKLLLRLYKKDFDVSTALELYVDPEQWNQAEQIFLDSPELNTKLIELKLAVLKRYNLDYCQGVVISKQWLQSVVSESFGRPSQEVGLVVDDNMIYLSDFSRNWLETKADKWKVSHNKTMDSKLKAQYQNFLSILLKYEQNSKTKIVMKDITTDTIYDFVNWMEAEGYSVSKIDREVGRFRFMCNRAVEDNIRIPSDFKKTIYLDKGEDIEGVYLDEKELEAVFNLDLSHDDNLDNSRDNLIISAYSGLRASDFMTGLNTDSIKDGVISIKTKKTNTFVKIPVHHFVKQILDKRFGSLPRNTTLTQYNKNVKIVCMLAGIEGQVYGKLWNPETNRKEIGYFKKYELVSSHVGRKSFASNLSGKVSDEVIMSCAGWSTQAMKNHYNKTSKTEYANKLNDYWQSNK